MTRASGPRGHRTVPHTADLRLEAWGTSRDDCIAEALRGLVGSFADVRGVAAHQAAGRSVERRLAAAPDADLLAAAVDEVIYCLDADGQVPAAVAVRPAADGGLVLALELIDASAVQIIGAAPKAASLSGLACAPDKSGQWRCAVTIDV